MKKLLAVLSVLFVMGTTSVFATGIGAQFGGSPSNSGFGTGAAVTFKLNSVPCVFAADFGFGNYFAVGLSADWWMANPKIEGTWGYYYGLGVGGSVYLSDGNFGYFAVGPRALIGTNVFVLKRSLEFYLQAAWQPLIQITSGSGLTFAWANFPIALGFRFWF